MTKLEDRILAVFDGRPTLSCLATLTLEGRPWVRYVVTQASDDMTFRCTSFIHARKVAQIAHTPDVHLTCGIADPSRFGDPYLQIRGRAIFTTDADERHAFWSDRLRVLFDGPDDPRYGIVVVRASSIEYTRVGMPVETWSRDADAETPTTAAWHEAHA